MQIKGSWFIKASREKIYNIMTDFENIPKYFPDVAKSVRILDEQGNNVILALESPYPDGVMQVRRSIELNPPVGYKSYDTTKNSHSFTDFSMTENSKGTKIKMIGSFDFDNIFYSLLFRVCDLFIIPGLVVRGVIKKRFKKIIIDRLKEILG
jgi:hypothetical protein